jgi:dTDP-L-rhamnose 4-epimerase
LKYLVTGGAGFIGSSLTRSLLERGDEVVILDSLEHPVHQNGVPFNQLPDDAEFIHGSVTDRNAWDSALQGVDRIFHLAGYADYQPDFSHFFDTNTTSTALLYELLAAGDFNVEKVVVASSQAIYGEAAYECPTHGRFMAEPRPLVQLESHDWDVVCNQCSEISKPIASNEDHVAPHNSYSMSKYALEMISHRLGKRYGIASVAVRYSIVHGPGQSFHNAYSGALRSFATRMLNGNPAVVFEDGEQFRDYVNIADVTRANILVMDSSAADYRSFNVGGDHWVSVKELAELVDDVIGDNVGWEASGLYRVGDTRHVVSDVSNLRALGWSPDVSLRDSVEEYIGWLSSVGDVPDTFTESQKVMENLGVLRRTSD